MWCIQRTIIVDDTIVMIAQQMKCFVELESKMHRSYVVRWMLDSFY